MLRRWRGVFMHHAELVDFRSTLAVPTAILVTQMFMVVKAAWPMSWLARGYREGSIHTVVNINTNIMMLFCSSFRRPRTYGQRYSGSLP